MDELLIDVREAARRLSLGRTEVYEMVLSGELVRLANGTGDVAERCLKLPFPPALIACHRRPPISAPVREPYVLGPRRLFARGEVDEGRVFADQVRAYALQVFLICQRRRAARPMTMMPLGRGSSLSIRGPVCVSHEVL